MADRLAAENSESRGEQKRRSSRACQSCRLAKTKCELLDTDSRCRRCVESSAPCLFAASRRGRIRGSKNRRTLEKLLNSTGQKSTSEQSGLTGLRRRAEPSAASEDTASPEPAFQDEDDAELPSYLPENDVVPKARESPNHIRPRQERSHRSGTSTPWNPQRLMIDTEGGHQKNRRTLARHLLHILGEFPVEGGGKEDGNTEPRGFQEPLWLIGGLAQRGWDVHNIHGNRKKPKQPTALPSTHLPEEDSRLLSKWTPQALREILREQSRYFEHGLLSSKCDVAQALDPIQHGLVTDERANELFQAYWEMVHPQWSILDPTLHTPELVRGRSALLTSTILALGSTALATLPHSRDEQVAEALRLHAHVEKLNLVVYATGARSIDIIQAQILLSRFGPSPRTRLDEQRWMRAAMIPRMGFEIGLNLSRRYDDNDDLDPEKAEKFWWNDLRTRGFMIINEYRFFEYSGRSPMDLSNFELKDTELDEVTRLSRDRSAVSLAAFYHLLLFQRDVRQRLEQYKSGFQTGVSLDAELEHIKVYIEKWISDWCPKDGDRCLNWHLTHDALSCWLLLAVRIARKRPQSSNTSPQQQLLLTLSIRLFKEALRSSQAIHTTHRSSIFSFAASIILRLSTRRDLVLRVALRMTREPGKQFIPTFVRDAGNQMLVMLCTNNLRPPSPISQPDDQTSRESTDNEEPSEETSGSQPQNPGQPVTEQHIQDEAATRPDGNLDDLAYPLGPIPQFGSQIGGDNIFAFNSAYLPYVPDPIQPQLQPHDSMLPPYPSADLDALIGAAVPPYLNFDLDALMGTGVPLGFDAANRSATNGNLHGLGDGNAVPEQPFNTSFRSPLDSTGSTQSHPQAPQGGSPWSMEEPSPVDTTYGTYSGSINGEDRTTQREVLLSTADRLIQLASRMQ